MKKVLLDTNAYIGYLTGNHDVLNTISQADDVFISVIILGELYAGFWGGSNRGQNNEILQRFLSKPTVSILQVTDETSEIFGQTKYHLKKSGTPIPINDIWIASQTMETGAVLITFDRHFEKILGLRIWDVLQ